MTQNSQRDQAIDALAPFITYFHSVSVFRQVGLYILVMMANFRASFLLDAIQQPGTSYHLLGNIKGPQVRAILKSVLIIVSVLWIFDAWFATNVLNFIILAVLLGSTCLVCTLAYAFTVARAGLLFQVRIPENYRALRALIVANQHQMVASSQNMIRYAPVAFHSMTRETFDAFRLLGIIEGVLAHQGLGTEDFAEYAHQEDDFEYDSLDKQEVSRG